MNPQPRVRDNQLWLALRLPDLPLNALGLDADARQALVVAERQRVVCTNAHGQSAGVEPGADITTAELLSGCETHPRDRELEQQALAALADRLYQFTPYIQTYTSKTTAEAGLLLELSRCLKLFGGLTMLAERIFADLRSTPYRFVFGLAHTAPAAWLLSFQHYAITGSEHAQLFCERLKDVPVHWLQDYPQAVEALQKTGFNTLGDVVKQVNAQSISSIKKRFGKAFAEAISDIFAIEQTFTQTSLFAKPAQVYQPQEFFFDTLQFDYPISQSEQLRWPMEIMLQKLAQYLRKRQLQCQHIEWLLYDIHHNSEKLSVYCDNAQSHWQLLHELTCIQLEQKQLPFEVNALELICRNTTALQSRSQALVLDDHSSNNRKSERRSQNFALTAAKLKARLGESALYKISYCDSHIPEHSNARIATHTKSQQQLPACQSLALRPTWLFDAPLPVEVRRQGLFWRGRVQLLTGPERIEGNWWHKTTARDYYLAQRQDYLRLWVFLDLRSNEWYVQGVFA